MLNRHVIRNIMIISKKIHAFRFLSEIEVNILKMRKNNEILY